MRADIQHSRMWFTEAASHRCRVRRVLAACGRPKDEHAANSARWVGQTETVRFAARMPLYDIGCAPLASATASASSRITDVSFAMGIAFRSQSIPNTDALANFKKKVTPDVEWPLLKPFQTPAVASLCRHQAWEFCLWTVRRCQQAPRHPGDPGMARPCRSSARPSTRRWRRTISRTVGETDAACRRRTGRNIFARVNVVISSRLI
jgi:hypothetical protein